MSPILDPLAAYNHCKAFSPVPSTSRPYNIYIYTGLYLYALFSLSIPSSLFLALAVSIEFLSVFPSHYSPSFKWYWYGVQSHFSFALIIIVCFVSICVRMLCVCACVARSVHRCSFFFISHLSSTIVIVVVVAFFFYFGFFPCLSVILTYTHSLSPVPFSFIPSSPKFLPCCFIYFLHCRGTVIKVVSSCPLFF